MKQNVWILISTILLLGGCSSGGNNHALQSKGAHSDWAYPPLAEPLQSTMQHELRIASLTRALWYEKQESPDIRARMFFERGMIYDSIGAKDLARADYNQSLSINPAQPDVFNLLGVYFLQVGNYDAANDAFDSALELDPNHQHAKRHRAVALYYGKRTSLALETISAHYDDNPNDPFRALWFYLIEFDANQELATQNLKLRYQQDSNDWGWILVSLMLDEISEEEALKKIVDDVTSNKQLAQRLTETYFYLGKRYRLQGDLSSAISLYKLALSFNVYEYVEHRFAFLELRQMFEQLQQERK